MEQLSHQQTPLEQHNLQLCVACNAIESPANLGLITRNAEAFGVKEILLSPSNNVFLKSNRFLKTARNAHQQINFILVESLVDELLERKKQAYQIVGVEWTPTSIPVQQMQHSEKTLLILGHENYGIDEQLLAHCDQVVHIRQFGQNSSINVAQALGIVLYELVR